MRRIGCASGGHGEQVDRAAGVFLWRGVKNWKRNLGRDPWAFSKCGRAGARDQNHLLADRFDEAIPGEHKVTSQPTVVAGRCCHPMKDSSLRGRYAMRPRANRTARPWCEIWTAQTDLCVVGISVCYDLRFPSSTEDWTRRRAINIRASASRITPVKRIGGHSRAAPSTIMLTLSRRIVGKSPDFERTVTHDRRSLGQVWRSLPTVRRDYAEIDLE